MPPQAQMRTMTRPVPLIAGGHIIRIEEMVTEATEVTEVARMGVVSMRMPPNPKGSVKEGMVTGGGGHETKQGASLKATEITTKAYVLHMDTHAHIPIS